MKTKHTPGSWRIGDAGATIFGPKTDKPAPEIIATITSAPFVNEKQMANARLIAAAPELLRELKALRNAIHKQGDEAKYVDRCHSAFLAIAKAEPQEVRK